ncbi:TetR/AcrR family transcriptional regulator [Brevibacillus fluminis]|uniref:TetR/AcrR family transcriptional regulator n=1 Tax=Brevibacillus fluminis TaxID=511487 RepID=A0A3M8CV93_9BACL|nr:TetR family transcriptional regulator [Brevibacillus fluminis]RNB79746.1 TetR/AcrR family transcriptional regulator [Brevibacillus fluminis]
MEITEDIIIKVALRLFSKKGYAATSIRDIASETNLTSSALYYYVESKKHLLLKIIEKGLNKLIMDAKNGLIHLRDPKDQLKELIRIHVINHGQEQLAALVIDTEYRSLDGEDRQKIRDMRREYEEIWLEVLRQGKNEGVFTYEDVRLATYALMEMCTGVAHWYVEGGRFTIEEIANQYKELGYRMVASLK